MDFVVKGFQGTSLLDFPGRIASLVFTGGCNLSCSYCHNLSLALEPEIYPSMPLQDLFAELESRKCLIDGVVVSGGEATLQPGLLDFLRKVKDMGLQVKLDTNGLRPDVLRKALEGKLVDFVAMDLKTSLDRYDELASSPVDPQLLRESIRLLLDCEIEYEFRTTCAPLYIDEVAVKSLAEEIRGAQKWVFQGYIPRGLSEVESKTYPAETIKVFGEMVKPFVKEVGFRGL